MLSHPHIIKILLLMFVWPLIFIVFLRFYTNMSNYNDSSRWNKLQRLANTWNNSEWEQQNERLCSENAKEQTDDELMANLEQELPNAPFGYWSRNWELQMQKNATCAPFTSPINLQYYNTYWQCYENGAFHFRLFGAYYDQRNSLRGGKVVRILTVINKMVPKKHAQRNYCQLWYENRTEPVIVEVGQYDLIWWRNSTAEWYHMPNPWYPHLLSCALPAKLKTQVPQAVSLVTAHCNQAKNNLKISYKARSRFDTVEQPRVAMCVLSFNLPNSDVSVRLVKWLELQRLQGIHKIIVYGLALDRNMARVLRYYEKQGLVEIQPLSLVSGEPHLSYIQQRVLQQPTLNALLHQLVAYNDCFYRHMYQYEYMVAINMDEVIVPLGNRNQWQQLNALVKHDQQATTKPRRQCYSAVCFQASVVWEEHLEPAKGISTKCFYNTSEVLTLNKHLPFDTLHKCKPHFIKLRKLWY